MNEPKTFAIKNSHHNTLVLHTGRVGEEIDLPRVMWLKSQLCLDSMDCDCSNSLGFLGDQEAELIKNPNNDSYLIKSIGQDS